MELFELTAHELRELLLKREISSVELTESIFKRIESVEGDVQAFITLTKEKALEQARQVDEKIAQGQEIPPLAGIPMGLKDNICSVDCRTTCASKMLENYVSPFDATVVERLKDNDAVIVGKMNMDEFAMGSSTETSWFYPTRNPWDLERVPGGSSGGPAAGVAAGEAVYSLGTDTGGSIRQPAAFCGVVGLKPTYGLVSRFGAVAFASSFDQIGPITKDVTDCALVLQAIAGHDPKDSTSVNRPVPNYQEALIPEVKGLKIGVIQEYLTGLDSQVERLIKEAIAKFEEMGAVVEEITMPHTEYALPTYYIIAPAECSSNLARFDGVIFGYRNHGAEDVLSMFMKTRAEGFGPEVKRRIMLGTYALSSGYYDAYYLKALKVRTLIKRDFEKAFTKYHVLLSPTTTSVAFKLGEKIDDPMAMYRNDLCTVTSNIAGLPAISIPCGFSEGLPVGLQLIAKHFDEVTLLRAAYAFEQATDFHRQRPPVGVK